MELTGRNVIKRTGRFKELEYDVDPVTGCWPVTSHKPASGTPSRYPRVRHNGKKEGAHRLSYRLNVGPIKPGYQIDHICGNYICVRPDHLQQLPLSVHTKIGWMRKKGVDVTPEMTAQMVADYESEHLFKELYNHASFPYLPAGRAMVGICERV